MKAIIAKRTLAATALAVTFMGCAGLVTTEAAQAASHKHMKSAMGMETSGEKATQDLNDKALSSAQSTNAAAMAAAATQPGMAHSSMGMAPMSSTMSTPAAGTGMVSPGMPQAPKAPQSMVMPANAPTSGQ